MSLVKIGMVAAVYFAGGKLGLAMAFAHSNVSPVWPPTGIALASLVILGIRYWPGVALGAFLVNFATPVPSPFLTACGIAVGNTLEAVLGACILQRFGFQRGLERLRDVFAILVGGAIVSTMASATIGVVTLCLGNMAIWPIFARLWWQWWLGDAMGDLVVAPLLLLWIVGPVWRESRGRVVEAATILIGLLASGVLVFGSPFDVEWLDNSYWVFPFLIWTALRFGPREVATALALVSCLAIWGTLAARGPFVREAVHEGASLVLLQMFLGVTTVTGLILAAVTAERQHAGAALQQLNAELEERVVTRTKELAQVNDDLAQVNRENEMFVHSVSHDLRSPLVNLQGFAQELGLVAEDLQKLVNDPRIPVDLQQRAQSLLDNDLRESLGFIQTGVMRLSKIIDALLRLSRAGRVEYRFQQVDVNEIAAQVVDSLNTTIRLRRASVRVAHMPAAFGDATAVEQIFANLIGNALNYLDARRLGRIEVGSLAPEAEGDHNRAAVSRTYFVKDNGMGIPLAHQTKLFQVFQRLHPEAAQGEGVGLAMVHRIVQRHGGEIWVESHEGVGSTFFFSLPAFNGIDSDPNLNGMNSVLQKGV